MFEVASVGDGMSSRIADIRNLPQLRSALNEFQPEIVFHLAAQALVRPSYESPVETYSTNVIGTVNLLEAVRDVASVKTVICITSDKCYKNKEWVWGYRESDELGGKDPYSSSKACAELVVQSYRDSFLNSTVRSEPVALATARSGNAIGGGDWARDRLIPDIIRSVETDQSVKIRYPQATRPWQHVLDPLHGYLLLAEKMWHKGEQYAGAWNFGPFDSTVRSVSWIAESMKAMYARHSSWTVDDGQYPAESKYLKLDCSKSHRLLRWAPAVDLEQTLMWIVEWYQKYYGGCNDMKNVTLSQIRAYEHQC
jgi:CDP-glucose 4,6-dehydratase